MNQPGAEDLLRVGGRTVPLDRAEQWVDQYLNGRGGTYAYPYYDRFAGGPADEITDADLLTPTLLNAAPTIAGFAALQGQRQRLEAALRRIPTHVDLVDADDEEISLLGPLYAPLDDPGGIVDTRGTRLSKVLHRKRPMFIPLYDEFVRRCYQRGEEAPLPPATGRGWAEFMVLLAGHMRQDLLRGLGHWDRLRSLGAHGPVSRLRVLDIVAWNLGGRRRDKQDSLRAEVVEENDEDR